MNSPTRYNAPSRSLDGAGATSYTPDIPTVPEAETLDGNDNPPDVAAFDSARGDRVTATAAVDAVKPLATRLDEHDRLSNAAPDLLAALQGAIAALTEYIPKEAKGHAEGCFKYVAGGFDMWDCKCPICQARAAIAKAGRIAELLDERAELLALLRDFVKASELGMGPNSKRLYLERVRAVLARNG